LTRATIDGNEAAASIAYRLNEVCCIYPITPASPMAELADEWASRHRQNIWGNVPSVVEMQSEGGAAGALHGALQGGALATTSRDHLTLAGIPEEAWAHRLGSRPALQLVVERLRPTTDKASGIENDPNDISDDPRYAVDLVKRVVRVAVETTRLVADLPEYRLMHAES